VEDSSRSDLRVAHKAEIAGVLAQMGNGSALRHLSGQFFRLALHRTE
jgi:hypothetical protein